MLDPKVRTLLAVVETGSFTKAAGLLSLTQPATTSVSWNRNSEFAFLSGKKGG